MAQKELNRTWGTWEELLLACAVKRHGFKNWDSVAMELRTRTSLPQLLTTALNCKLKYHDLNRRFTNHIIHNQDDTVPWLDELRQLRLAELRQEVQRYDVSILSLQLKVKSLEEEREQTLKEDEDGEGKPDLDGERSENDKKNESDKSEPEKVGAKFVTGEESDRENRSFNESNSTGIKSENIKTSEEDAEREHEPVEAGSGKTDPICTGSKPVGENSCNESSDSIIKNRAFQVNEPSQGKKGGESSELRDSVGRSKGVGETKESSEVQSSVSLRRKRKRKGRQRKEISGGSSGDEPPEMEELAVNSEPLGVGLLEMIRAHKDSSLFERRLQTQESDKYKSMVRQHVDLETIQTRLQQNSYSSSTLSFYRDLLLLFNNAIIFFPKASLESTTAHELRILVSNEMKKETQKSDSSHGPSPSLPILLQPKPESDKSDSFLAKHKSTSVPIIVCRKRSSISTKPSSSTSFGPRNEQQNEEKKQVEEAEERSLIEVKAKEKPITGARSLRRSNKKVSSTNTPTPSKKQITSLGGKAGSSIDKLETPPKKDNKKNESLALEKKKSAADFLKRIKRNSPVEKLKRSSRSGDGEQKRRGGGNEDTKGKERVLRNSSTSKRRVKEENSPSKRSVGRPPKKAAEASSGAKRVREGGGGGGGKEVAAVKRPRPRKRSRR